MNAHITGCYRYRYSTLSTVLNLYTNKLETLLTRDFAADGATLTDKITSIEASLPEELKTFLQQLASRADELRNTSASNDEIMEFIYRCGQAQERLELLKTSWIAETVDYVQADGLAPTELAPPEEHALVRFITARDRILKQLANFMLKFLLLMVALLILGMVIGIV